MTKLPRSVSYALAATAGTIAYVLARSARGNIETNLAVVLDKPPSSRSVRRTARHAFCNNAKNWVDTLRLGTESAASIERKVDLDGWEHIPNSLAAGKGLIIIGAHVGNIDCVGQIMVARGFPLTVPVETVEPPALFERTQRLRQQMGIKTVPMGSAARQLLSALKRGETAGIIADRNVTGDGIAVQLFGRPTLISKGPAWIARKAECPVVVGTGLRMPRGRLLGQLGSPLPMQLTDDEDADLQVNSQTIMSAVEERIRRHPEQWAMFAKVWEGRPDSSTVEVAHAV